MKRKIIVGTVLAMLIMCPTAQVGATQSSRGPSIATFEGKLIDLRLGWSDAKACTSDGETTSCFRSEDQLDHYLAEAAATVTSVLNGFSIESLCSTALKLYSNTSFGGTVLSLSTINTTLNLSAFAFDNVTSSYRVGACNTTFYDGANLGAPVYPGNTSAGASATSMVAGWDNRISSVTIA